MASKKSRSLQTSLLLCFVLLSALSHSQGERIVFDSVFRKIFDAELKPLVSKKLTDSDKPLIIVSTTHCSGCVKYFAQSAGGYRFVFLMNYESLLEVNRILGLYGLKPEQAYFATAAYLDQKSKAISGGPTPVAIYKSRKDHYFLDYQDLNHITAAFTAEHRKVRKAFRDLEKK